MREDKIIEAEKKWGQSFYSSDRFVRNALYVSLFMGELVHKSELQNN